MTKLSELWSEVEDHLYKGIDCDRKPRTTQTEDLIGSGDDYLYITTIRKVRISPDNLQSVSAPGILA